MFCTLCLCRAVATEFLSFHREVLKEYSTRAASSVRASLNVAIMKDREVRECKKERWKDNLTQFELSLLTNNDITHKIYLQNWKPVSFKVLSPIQIISCQFNRQNHFHIDTMKNKEILFLHNQWYVHRRETPGNRLDGWAIQCRSARASGDLKNRGPRLKKIICSRRMNSRRINWFIRGISNKTNSGLFLFDDK